MEFYFATLFEDIRHELSLISIRSLTDEGIVKQTGFTDHEIYIMEKSCFKTIT